MTKCPPHSNKCHACVSGRWVQKHSKTFLLCCLTQLSPHSPFLPGPASQYTLGRSRPVSSERKPLRFELRRWLSCLLLQLPVRFIRYQSSSWSLKLSYRNNHILSTQTMSFYSVSPRLPRILFTIKICEFPDRSPHSLMGLGSRSSCCFVPSVSFIPRSHLGSSCNAAEQARPRGLCNVLIQGHSVSSLYCKSGATQGSTATPPIQGAFSCCPICNPVPFAQYPFGMF